MSTILISTVEYKKERFLPNQFFMYTYAYLLATKYIVKRAICFKLLPQVVATNILEIIRLNRYTCRSRLLIVQESITYFAISSVVLNVYSVSAVDPYFGNNGVGHYKVFPCNNQSILKRENY